MSKYSINHKINYRSNCGPKTKLSIKEKYDSQILDLHSIDFPKQADFKRTFGTRIALRLPPGIHKLWDGIYNYELQKYDNKKTDMIEFTIYHGLSSITSERITYFRREQSVFDRDDRDGRTKIYYHGDVKRPSLSCLISCGGISVHSDDVYSGLSRLSILPRGSFKQYVQNEI